MARSRVTLDDIATASDTSLAAVSLALRNKPGVSRETRERILANARDLGYQRPARVHKNQALALRNIALVIRTWSHGPERNAPTLNPFYSWVVTGIHEAARESRMNMLLGTIPVDAGNTPTDMCHQLLQQRLDGVLLVGSHRPETVRTVLDALPDHTPPVVLVDSRPMPGVLDSVGSDNVHGGYLATADLIRQGHRRISYFGPASRWEPNFADRRDGFLRALADHGLEPYLVTEVDEVEEGSDLHGALFANSTATFCGNDDHAMLLMRLARGAGVDVPGHHSVIGFDDTTVARHALPPLGTMAVDKVTMGMWAVQLLDNRITRPDAAPVHITITPQLVIRESTRWLAPHPDGTGGT